MELYHTLPEVYASHNLPGSGVATIATGRHWVMRAPGDVAASELRPRSRQWLTPAGFGRPLTKALVVAGEGGVGLYLPKPAAGGICAGDRAAVAIGAG